jgi:hypothetical protein
MQLDRALSNTLDINAQTSNEEIKDFSIGLNVEQLSRSRSIGSAVRSDSAAIRLLYGKMELTYSKTRMTMACDIGIK